MKHTNTVTQSKHTLNTDEWIVRVYDYNPYVLLTLQKSAFRRAILTGAIAGLLIAAVGFTLTNSASTIFAESTQTPVVLQLD